MFNSQGCKLSRGIQWVGSLTYRTVGFEMTLLRAVEEPSGIPVNRAGRSRGTGVSPHSSAWLLMWGALHRIGVFWVKVNTQILPKQQPITQMLVSPQQDG